MTDIKNKPEPASNLEDLVHDLDLDMDAPLGATFAAALRDDTRGGPGRDDGDADDLVDDILSEYDLDEEVEAEMEAAPPPRDAGRSVASKESPAATNFDDDFVSDDDDGDANFNFSDSDVASQEPQDLPAHDEVASHDDGGGDYLPNSSGGDRILPRITMHAFCMRSKLLAEMRRIGDDRRMANVTLEVFEGGIPSAIQYYGSETTPNLLVIEAPEDRTRLLAELDALAEHCDENIRVVVIGETNDIRLYRELMDRGVSEYLVSPIHPVQLIRSIGALFSDPETPFVGKTLAVTGVKGGVGASAVAHNLAWALSERIKVNATLVDLDLNFGTTGLDFNQENTATIADALMSPDRFDEAVMGRLITKATDRLSLFTAPATLDRTYDLDPETYVQVLELVRGSVPFVVLDLPHIWSDWFKSTIMSSDEIIVVATPDLASLRNGKNLIDFLKAARPNDAPPRLVLNMYGLPKRPEIPPKDFGQAIGVEPELVLPFDAQLFGTAANNGQMIFDVAPESKCAQGIDALAASLSGREIQTAKASLMKKILGR